MSGGGYFCNVKQSCAIYGKHDGDNVVRSAFCCGGRSGPDIIPRERAGALPQKDLPAAKIVGPNT